MNSPTLKLTTILHPTDFSGLSEHAFHLACSLARDHGADLIVLHVAVPPVVAYEDRFVPPPEGEWKALEDRLFRIRPADPSIQVRHRLEEGMPAAEILRVAEESRCDLIVMGSHGRSGVTRLLMGSVAEHVLRKATCPVLVAKGTGSNSPVE